MHFSLSLAAVALLGTASALPNPNGDFGHAWKPYDKHAWGTGSVSHSASQPTAPAGTGSVPEVGKPGPTGGNHTVKPIGTGSVPGAVTETTKVYTTTTVCPVTTTEWAGNKSTVVMTLTTSTITVTSCPGGCHGKGSTPTTTPVIISDPTQTQPIIIVTPTTSGTSRIEDFFPVTGGTVKTITFPATSTITSFVPCSTPVNSNAETTFYSTWLTVTYLTTTYLTTSCETIYPTSTPSIPDTVVPSSPATVTANPGTPEEPAKPAEPWTSIITDVTTLPPTTVVGVPSGTCPAPETVYETVVSYVTVYGAGSPNSPPTATPIKPGSTLSWGAGPVGGHAKPTGYVKPTGYAKPSGH